MATITEDYCSQEVYRLLREKGFDGEIHTTFDKEGYTQASITLQMAMKWLREAHGLFISIGNDDLDYNWQIFDVRNRTKDLDPTCLTESYAGYIKYELACTLAIKYCLKNLI